MPIRLNPLTFRLIPNNLVREMKKILLYHHRAGQPRLCRGIADYARTNSSWEFLRIFNPDDIAAAGKLNPDGCIAQIDEPTVAKLIAAQNINPTVIIHGSAPFNDFPHIGIDDFAIGRMAADHLIGLGFEHFGYYAPDSFPYCPGRGEGFTEALQALGQTVDPFEPSGQHTAEALEHRATKNRMERTCGWLATLPKPVAILACDDSRAGQITNACHQINLSIPNEVAVMGPENHFQCHFFDPPLTSIEIPDRDIGYKAAKLLHHLMQGDLPPNHPVLLPPTGVIERESTQTFITPDPIVTAMLQFIHAHACDGISVQDVVRHSGYSRATIANRFRTHRKTSVLKEILNVKLEKIKQLLRKTDMTLAHIAMETGFTNPYHLCRRFKQNLGITPGQYRKQFRNRL